MNKFINQMIIKKYLNGLIVDDPFVDHLEEWHYLLWADDEGNFVGA